MIWLCSYMAIAFLLFLALWSDDVWDAQHDWKLTKLSALCGLLWLPLAILSLVLLCSPSERKYR